MTEILIDNAFKEFIRRLERTEISPKADLNIFDVGARGYLENPTSDLMAFFMGLRRDSPRWLVGALLSCLHDEGALDEDYSEVVDLNAFRAEREISCDDEQSGTRKFLDILVSSDDIVIGIENKVTAGTGYNPFDVYSFAVSKIADQRKVVNVILAAKKTRVSGVEGWPIIGYDELAEKAETYIGRHVREESLSKWHIFYIEFLQHLHHLATNRDAKIMDDRARQFAEKNIDNLRKAKEMLALFEEDLRADGEMALARVLRFNEVKRETHTWPYGVRVLRFHPDCWPDGAQILVGYSPAQDENGEPCIEHFVTSYLPVMAEKRPQFDALKSEFTEKALEAEGSWYAEETDREKNDIAWYEGNGKTLGMGAWVTEDCREGAMEALADIAHWLNERIKKIYG